MLPGVFRSAQWPCNREQVLAAVCARNPAAMIGFTTAGQLWAWRRVSDPKIHVLVPHGCSPELDGVVVHRCRRIDPVDIVQRADGIRLTSPPRTIFDSADMIGAQRDGLRTRAATQRAVGHVRHDHRHSATAVPPEPARVPQRCSKSSGRDRLGGRRCSPTSKSGYWTRCRGRNCRMPTTQFPMRPPGYDHDIAIDFAWPSVKLAIEVDHPAWHDGAVELTRRQGSRSQARRRLGGRRRVITDIDVTRRPP